MRLIANPASAFCRRSGLPDEELLLFREELMQCLASSLLRLRCGSVTAASPSEAADLLQTCGSSPLHLEAAREVSLLRKGEVRPQRVWPEGDLPARQLMLANRLLPCRGVAALPPAFLLHEPLRLVAVLPGRRRRLLRVPRDGCVLDLLCAARLPDRMQAVLQGRALREDASLRGLRDGEEVRLQRLQVDIRVRFGQRELRWRLPEDREEVTFGEIVAGVSEGLREQRRTLLAGVLSCKGCGRKLSCGRQAVQRVPADCCEVTSMHLCFGGKPRCERCACPWLAHCFQFLLSRGF